MFKLIDKKLITILTHLAYIANAKKPVLYQTIIKVMSIVTAK